MPDAPDTALFYVENVEFDPPRRRTMRLNSPDGALIGFASFELTAQDGATIVEYHVYSSSVLPEETVAAMSEDDLAALRANNYKNNYERFAAELQALKVLVENGREVYGSAFVSREYAVQQGMSGYAKALEAAMGNERVTATPLTVKGLRTEGPGRCDVVISNADATRIRNAAEHLSFMKKCRVMIVVD